MNRVYMVRIEVNNDQEISKVEQALYDKDLIVDFDVLEEYEY